MKDEAQSVSAIWYPSSPSRQYLLRLAFQIGLTFAVLLLAWRLTSKETVGYLGAGMFILCLRRQPSLALAIAVADIVVCAGVRSTVRWLPNTYDAMLWRLDGLLGFDPSAWIMAWFQEPLLNWFGHTAYFGLPLATALTIAFSRRPKAFYLKLCVATLLGYLLYFAVPAMGPVYWLKGIQGPRNAMPSLHFTWALLLWQELRKKNLGVRVGADLFLICTAMATVGLGEHYLIDLIAAVPFWRLVEYLLEQKSRCPKFRVP